LILVITLLAFGLRVWQLEGVPPGWRDDELINSLVISQKVLDGDWMVYFPDASGHEWFYHTLSAGMLALFGPNALGMRLLSAILGTLAVPVLFVMGRRLGGTAVGLTAAAALAVSFWSLMYSRFGLRHITMPLLALLTITFFWQTLFSNPQSSAPSPRAPILMALFMALGFYTYFAGRGVPLILLAFVAYLVLFDRKQVWRRGRPLALGFGLAAALAIPLVVTLAPQSEVEGRVGELAVPLVEARQGNFEPMLEQVRITLGMFHANGDGEFLYNIPGRPVFGVVGAVFFWAGVGLALWQVARGLPGDESGEGRTAVFLLLWWLAGIAPGFVSVPPASLGHTIVAQPAVFLLAAWPIKKIANRQLSIVNCQWFAVGLGLLLVAAVAVRDVPDYFVRWPQRGMVRFLYRADVAELADVLAERPDLTDFGVTGLLAGPWDRLALAIDAQTAVYPRWYNPERVALLMPSLSFMGFPETAVQFADVFTLDEPGVTAGAYQFFMAETAVLPPEPMACFVNGLCLLVADYDAATGQALLLWQAAEALDLPPMPLISNPPPPGVYAGPRLSVFAHLLDGEGQL
ncbi:MAG: glycosyltransferase family 39 protein, partial [Anaerolineae bacterium]